MNKADADILTLVRAQFHAAPPARLGVAVSGGSDSVALLHILANCFEPGQVEIFAATVDHGLRAEASDEARQVDALAKSLGIPHEILKWQGWDGTGNLQDQARKARYHLLSEWSKSHAIAVLAVGHTADDQAETVLMRLGRAAGVTGLAAMPVHRTLNGITIFRPLLGVARDELRSYLLQNGVSWIEDPSNEDLQFDRVKVRRALEVLEPLGLTAKALAGVARNMGQAREALDWYSFLSARDLATVEEGDIVLDLSKLRALPDEISRRLLLRAMLWINGAQYPPRSAPMTQALNAVRLGKPVTLGGCRALPQGKWVWICREFAAVRRTRGVCADVWDGRWQLTGGDPTGCELRALGRRGLMQCPDWRATGRPHVALTASPAVWRGNDLVAAPLAGMANGWRANLVAGREEFYSSLLSH